MKTKISRRGRNVARNGPGLDETEYGIHVYLTLEDAKKHNYLCSRKRAVIKIRVKGFLRSGKFANKRSETWKEYRVLKVIRK